MQTNIQNILTNFIYEINDKAHLKKQIRILQKSLNFDMVNIMHNYSYEISDIIFIN